MRTVTQAIREHALSAIGVVIEPIIRRPPLEVLRKTEYYPTFKDSPTFDQLCWNRLVMGSMRYGLMADRTKGNFDCITSIRARLNRYEKDGNAELLADIANLAMVEFVNGNHNGVISVDDSEDHARKKE